MRSSEAQPDWALPSRCTGLCQVTDAFLLASSHLILRALISYQQKFCGFFKHQPVFSRGLLVSMWFDAKSVFLSPAPDIYPGNYMLRGSQGTWVAAANDDPPWTAITLEHIPKALSPTGQHHHELCGDFKNDACSTLRFLRPQPLGAFQT